MFANFQFSIINFQSISNEPIFNLLIFGALALVALLAVVRYRVAVVLIVALLPSYLLRFSVFGIPTNVLEMAILILALVGALQSSVRQSWRRAWQQLPRAVLILVLLFVIPAIISTFVSPHLWTSLGILKGWILIPIIFGWIVYAALRHSDFVIRHSFGIRISSFDILRALILSGVVIALIGVSQFGQLDRIKSIYDVPNSLALFLAPILVLTIWQSLSPKNNYSLLTTHYKLFSAVMAVALLGTQSVSGIVAAVVVLFIGTLLWLHGPQRRYFLLVIGGGVLIAFLTLMFTGRIAYFVGSNSSFSNFYFPISSLRVRLQLWSISWDLIKQHPILGIGLGTFEPAYQQELHKRFQEYEQVCQSGIGHCNIGNSLEIRNWKLEITNQPLAEFVFRDPHNWLLSFWLNTGLLGLISFTGLHVFIFYHSWKQVREMRNQKIENRSKFLVSSFTILSLLVLLIMGLVDTIYWKNDLSVLHWLLFALLTAQRPSSRVI